MKPLLLFLLLTIPASAQNGTVIEDLKMPSQTLGEDVTYSIYLPHGYDRSTRYYPVVYLLHGYSDDDSGWIQFGEMDRIVDKAIRDGDIPPMIIAMPDGKVSFYINNHDNSIRWEDMFVDEFMPHIEGEYRIRQKKEFRGIAGLSMGGYGSLALSMRNPDLFAATAAFSSAVSTEESMLSSPDEQYNNFYGKLFGPRTNGAMGEHWKSHSIIDIVKSGDQEKLKSVRYYIDCGDDDFLAIGNSMLHVAMLEQEIPHEYRVREGAHSWGYWRTGLPDGLKFISQSFHR